jgi:hypothetical protein
VLADLGYAPDDIDAMIDAGAAGPNDPQ